MKSAKLRRCFFIFFKFIYLFASILTYIFQELGAEISVLEKQRDKLEAELREVAINFFKFIVFLLFILYQFILLDCIFRLITH